jgi:hypothetical protein
MESHAQQKQKELKILKYKMINKNIKLSHVHIHRKNNKIPAEPSNLKIKYYFIPQ